ncbi:MAG: hypothetical protein M3Q31_23205 [Actinomycetota bacterium]|nr:hypothetical protein [Actinomycetota bacterium]
MRIALPQAARAGFAALALALFAVACSSSSQDGAAPAGGQVLQVKVKDFAIKAPKQLTPGTIVLHVRNAGPDTHELFVVRADGHTLPLRPDNLTVDEDAVKPRTVGTLEDARPGTLRTWKLHFTAGRYILFCNMSGHYLGGMHTLLVVR